MTTQEETQIMEWMVKQMKSIELGTLDDDKTKLILDLMEKEKENPNMIKIYKLFEKTKEEKKWFVCDGDGKPIEETNDDCSKCGIILTDDDMGSETGKCEMCNDEEEHKEYNAGFIPKPKPTQEEFMSKFTPLWDLSKKTQLDGVQTLDKDIKVGDVVRMGGHWMDTDNCMIYEVSKLTKCFIVFEEAHVEKHTIRHPGGDTHTFSRYIRHGIGTNQKRKKIDWRTDQRGYDGYKVFKKTEPIWVLTGKDDFMR
tara:strand:+ start:529 stop:1290 length:762 start_codon:yes stop_codon:yes gene_type:complete